MTHWFNKQAGEPMVKSQDDPTMFLVGDQIPDWVRLPVPHGGTRHRVASAVYGPCPCGADHEAITLELEGTPAAGHVGDLRGPVLPGSPPGGPAGARPDRQPGHGLGSARSQVAAKGRVCIVAR